MKRYRVFQFTFSLLMLLFVCMLSMKTQAHSPKFSALSVIEAPPAPVLEQASEGQTLYRIDPNQSKASYSVQEVYVGTIDGKRVVGSTNSIAGDVLIDWNDFSQSQLGMITVDVEQLSSDSRQRDRQIRRSYLESSLYPKATFIPEEEQEFPSTVGLGESVQFVVHGFLTVKDITILSDWTINLSVEENQIVGRATTDILMSDFGVGPISIVGLLSTEDEMQLTLEFVALPDGEVSNVVATPPVFADAALSESDLMFSDIRPIIETKCVGCHLEGEIGHGIYPMETVADVVDYAEDLALVIETGFMPPWSPSHLTPAFKNDRSLNDTDKATLLEWIAAGAVNDTNPTETLIDRAPSDESLREDIVLEMPEPYVPSGELFDDYRCFLIDPNLPEGGFVTGSNVLPGDGRVVHHVILFQASVASLEEAAAKDAEDDLPGWECFGGTGLTEGGLNQLGGNVGAWVPGSQPIVTSPGTGIVVEPGNQIVMQVHYNYEAGFFPDQTSAILQVEAADADLIPLISMPLIAPVEIPCPAESNNEACDREVSIAKKPEQDQRLAGQLLRLCGKDLSDYEGQTADNAATFCDWRVPVDGELTTIGGHLHTRGKSLNVTLNPESNSPVVLQDLPIWDFNWQGRYDYETPIAVKKGDIVRLSCTWDNTQHVNPDDASYMTWGEGTNDEMCLTAVSIKPADGFAHISSTEIFMTSLAILPEWMPVWARVGVLALRANPIIGQLLLVVVVLLVIAALLIFRRRRLRRSRASVKPQADHSP